MADTNLWIMSGTPGCGKSYFSKNILATDDSWQYISRDEVRYSLLQEGDSYFQRETKVFDEFCNKIIYALGCDEFHNVIADATHLNEKSRMKLINRVCPREMGVNVFCVYFNTPLDICQTRNKSREGRARVPEDVIQKMYYSRSHPSHDKFTYNGIMEVSGL